MFLNRVLDTRTGIPVTLSLIYLEVGRRLGIQCEGVGLPGHFLVRLEALDQYLDPFNRGRLVTVADCRRLVRERTKLHLSWRDEYLTPYSKKDVLYRILNNLRGIYLQAGDYPRAIEALNRMALIYPQALYVNRDLFWCYANTQDRDSALRHLEMYLESAWPSPEASEMQQQVESIWSAISQITRQSG